MIACYCRVSSRGQKMDSQKAELTRWLTSQGIELTTVQWFEDIETGLTLRRPAFTQLQRAIFDGAITTVVVWKLDRLSRRQHVGITLLADWCERDVRVIVVTQQIDLRGAVGRMVASVLFGLAEIEMEYRHERQTAGIARRCQKPWGVPRTTKRHHQSPAAAGDHPASARINRARNCQCVTGQSTDSLPVSRRDNSVRLPEW